MKKLKVRKLLPGGLLTKTMRLLVSAGQKSGVPKLSERVIENEKLINTGKEIIKNDPKKFLSVENKLGPEVTRDLARNISKGEKASYYKKILKSGKEDPVLKKENIGIDESITKLDEYGKKLVDTTKAIIDKDIQKPLLQSKGGIIKGKPRIAQRGWK